MTRQRWVLFGVVLVAVLAARPGAVGAEEAASTEAPAESAAPPPPSTPEPTVADLARDLRSLDPARRDAAVSALSERGGDDAVAALAGALRSEPSADVRAHMVRALAAIGGERADRAICQTASVETNDGVRALARRLCPPAPGPEVAAAAPVVLDVMGMSDSQLRLLARRLRPFLEEERNDPYRRRIRAAWIVYGVSSGLGLIPSIISTILEPELGSYSLIPLLGPIVSGGLLISDGWEEEIALGVTLIAIAAVQISGLVLAIVAHRQQRRAYREANPGSDLDRDRERRRVSLVPTPAGLVGVF